MLTPAQIKPKSFESSRNIFFFFSYPWRTRLIFTCVLGRFAASSIISTQTFRRALTASLDSQKECGLPEGVRSARRSAECQKECGSQYRPKPWGDRVTQWLQLPAEKPIEECGLPEGVWTDAIEECGLPEGVWTAIEECGLPEGVWTAIEECGLPEGVWTAIEECGLPVRQEILPEGVWTARVNFHCRLSYGVRKVPHRVRNRQHQHLCARVDCHRGVWTARRSVDCHRGVWTARRSVDCHRGVWTARRSAAAVPHPGKATRIRPGIIYIRPGII